jgi:hypothetical protein
LAFDCSTAAPHDRSTDLLTTSIGQDVKKFSTHKERESKKNFLIQTLTKIEIYCGKFFPYLSMFLPILPHFIRINRNLLF